MRKTILFTFFILALSAGVFGQNTQPQMESKVIRWSMAKPSNCCDSYAKDNNLWMLYEDKNIFYTVSISANEFHRDRKEIVFTVSVQNKTERRMLVDPSKFSLRMASPVNKTYSPINPEELIKRKIDTVLARKLYSEMILPTDTLLANEMVMGLIYFNKKKMKIAQGYVLSFTIENTTYEVPFGTERMEQN